MSVRVLGPAVSGRWYPEDPRELALVVDDLLAEPWSDPDGSCARAVVAPHAGFAYSGKVAGMGLRRLPVNAHRILLLGPAHYAAFEGASVPEAEAYRTPLGDVRIDLEAVSRLVRSTAFARDDRPFAPEHSLESELPFLQRRLGPEIRIVPVLLGSLADPVVHDRVVSALAAEVNDATHIVVSSDFTHYGPRFGYVPFRDRVPERIRQLDLDAIAHVTRLDGPGFREYVHRTGATICGRAAIDVLLGILPPDRPGELVAYDTSGRITGDFEHSVSYASIVFR